MKEENIGEIEEIDIIHIDDMPTTAKEEVEQKVTKKSESFQKNFKGFAEIRIISGSPMRVDSIEPIQGTDVDWIKKKGEESGIDISDIF